MKNHTSATEREKEFQDLLAHIPNHSLVRSCKLQGCYGRLPLHVAVQYDLGPGIVEVLLGLYPGAASHADRSPDNHNHPGSLPLHLVRPCYVHFCAICAICV